MSIKVGINGFGRIGRMVFRASVNHPEIEIVGINDLCPADYLAYMLKYDTMHGQFNGEVSATENAIVVNGKSIPIFAERDPKNIPWGKLEAEYVVESTAAYVRKLAKAHDEEMAFLSNLGQLVPPEMAPAKGSDPSEDIKAALAAQIRQEEEQPQPQAAPEKPAPRLVAVGPDDDVPPMPDDLEPLSGQGQDEFELDPDATRRYSDLQFGKDYEIQ